MFLNVCEVRARVSSSDICISTNFRINEIQFDIIFRSLIKNSNSLSEAHSLCVCVCQRVWAKVIENGVEREHF